MLDKREHLDQTEHHFNKTIKCTEVSTTYAYLFHLL
jgi:hypothetical protein